MKDKIKDKGNSDISNMYAVVDKSKKTKKVCSNENYADQDCSKMKKQVTKDYSDATEMYAVVEKPGLPSKDLDFNNDY